jgi:UDPglucose--hexose-1-phosphate uridylyltransferase
MSELRWNPLLGEWSTIAAQRQERTFLPATEFCPLCPTKPGGFQTEIPEPDFEVVVFENQFPAFRRSAPPVGSAGNFYRKASARGVCEVVVYSPDHVLTLGNGPAQQIFRVVQTWIARFKELGSLDYVKYVLIFENKGEVVGVTLSHPHGQIYACPFIPPLVQRELDQCRKHHDETGDCLLCAILRQEKSSGQRTVIENDSFLAYVPFFARWPYEVHVITKRHIQTITELSNSETLDLARLLKVLLNSFDRVFNSPLPYMMVMHQGPTDGGSYDFYHFHIEFYIPQRTATKLKYLAGAESGGGAFVNDRLAEQSAADLRDAIKAAEAELSLH